MFIGCFLEILSNTLFLHKLFISHFLPISQLFIHYCNSPMVDLKQSEETDEMVGLSCGLEQAGSSNLNFWNNESSFTPFLHLKLACFKVLKNGREHVKRQLFCDSGRLRATFSSYDANHYNQLNSLVLNDLVQAFTFTLSHCCTLLMQLGINVSHYPGHQNILCVVHLIDTCW